MICQLSFTFDMQSARRNWSRSWYDDQRSCATRRRFKSNKNWDCEIFPAETTYGIKGLHAKASRINTLMIIKWAIPYKCKTKRKAVGREVPWFGWCLEVCWWGGGVPIGRVCGHQPCFDGFFMHSLLCTIKFDINFQ